MFVILSDSGSLTPVTFIKGALAVIGACNPTAEVAVNCGGWLGAISIITLVVCSCP